MKKMVCEMCESSNFMKQDGVFVCQSCGCSYSLEEARKLMVEVEGGAASAPVAAGGTAPTQELENLYRLARRAKDDDNSENAAKYYDMILLKDPLSWEAAFYQVYFKAMSCKIAHIRSAAISVSNCLDNVLALVRDHVSDPGEQLTAVTEISARSAVIARMLYHGAKNHYDGIDASIKHNYTQEMLDNCCAARDILYTCGDQIDAVFGDTPIAKLAVGMWKGGIEYHEQLLPRFANQSLNRLTIQNYTDKIGKHDPQFGTQRKRKALEEEIRSLRGQLDLAYNTKITGKGCAAGLGIGLIILGVIFIAGGIAIDAMVTAVCGGVEILIGLIFALASLGGKSKAVQIRERDEKIRSLTLQLQQKEAELQKLG